MAFARKSGGANVTPTTVKRRSGGAWVTPNAIYRRLSGAWVLVWSGALTATPSSVDVSAPRGTGTKSGSTTLSKAATGAWLSGGANISASISGLVVTFSSSSGNAGAIDINRNGTYRLTASDGTGQIVDVPVNFNFTGTA